jgi:hypothetical protein
MPAARTAGLRFQSAKAIRLAKAITANLTHGFRMISMS